MSADTPQLHFYTRKACCLCDVAYEVLEPVATAMGVPIETIDIDQDPTLRERFGTLVPVVTLDGNAIFTYRVDAEQARAHLERARARRAAGGTP